MIMPFAELNEFWDDTLEIPIRGKVYKIPSPDAETGLWCQQVFEMGVRAESGQKVSPTQTAKLKLNDDEEQELYGRVLGPVKQEMIDDGLSWARISAVAQTAIIWIATDRGTAERYWNEQVVGGGPKAPKQPQDHKPPAKKAAAKRTGTTRSSRQGSHAGSKPRKNSTAPAASAGQTSSSTGS